MKVFMLNRKCCRLMSFGIRTVRESSADALLCAACFSLYGIVFGGFGALVRHELSVSWFISVGSHWAMIGVVIGAVVGLCREIIRARNIQWRLMERARQKAVMFSDRHTIRTPENSIRGVTQNPLIVFAGKSQPRITALGG